MAYYVTHKSDCICVTVALWMKGPGPGPAVLLGARFRKESRPQREDDV